MGNARRVDRFHPEPDKADARTPFERDRDRILYTTEFRRLAGITQTATTGGPALLLHNRLTHALKVAQIGRRLAERLVRTQPEEANALQLDPEVVESACLAHDIGHPPFGHLTEEILDCLVKKNLDVPDGFEGNAQTFRILTKLAQRRASHPGLNLTRATLNAVIKYPWLRKSSGRGQTKFNAYASEASDFGFARELDPNTERKSVEAELMDWADDIAYSVHDVEDFYVAGRIPLDRLITRQDERDLFLQRVFERWEDRKIREAGEFSQYASTLNELLQQGVFAIERPFAADPRQRHVLQQLSSFLVDRYVQGISLRVPSDPSEAFVVIDPEKQREITMLKELTWQYVILDASLATQQFGQETVIRSLFEAYAECVEDQRRWHLLPARYRDIAKDNGAEARDNKEVRARLVCDLISGMTEVQVMEMYRRLHGLSHGPSLSDIIV